MTISKREEVRLACIDRAIRHFEVRKEIPSAQQITTVAATFEEFVKANPWKQT